MQSGLQGSVLVSGFGVRSTARLRNLQGPWYLIGSSVDEPGQVEEGLRALLLTDIVDSTAFIHDLGDRRAAELFARADRVARDLLIEHRGLEIDHTDGFLLLFERPADAVQYAVALHRALDVLSGELGRRLEMRVGVHVGSVVMRKNPPADVARGAKPIEVEGLAKPFAARVMSMAGGGQTLLSRAAWDLARRASIGDPSLEALTWTPHGDWQIKGVAEPVEVFEVGAGAPTPPASNAKARRVRKSRRAVAVVGLAAAAFVVGLAAAWAVRSDAAGYTTFDAVGVVSRDARVQAQFEAAHASLQLDDLAAASDQLVAARTVEPHNAEIYLWQFYVDLQSAQNAKQRLREAVRDDTLTDRAPDALARIIERWASDGGSNESFDRDVVAHLEAHPDHVIAWALYGAIHIEIGKHYPRAADAFERVARGQTGFVDANAKGAELFVHLDQPERAQRLLAEGQVRFPTSNRLPIARAEFLIQTGQAQASLPDLKRVLRDRPDALDVRRTLALAYAVLGEDEALDRELALLTGPLVPARHRFTTLERLGLHVQLFGGRFALGRRLTADAMALADTAELDAEAFEARMVHGWFWHPDMVQDEDYETMTRWLEKELLSGTRSASDLRRVTTRLRLVRARAAIHRGDLDEAVDLYAGHPADVPDMLDVKYALVALGALPPLEKPPKCWVQVIMGEYRAHYGSPEAARGWLEYIDKPDCTKSAIDKAGANAHLATHALARGDHEEAHRRVARFHASMPQASKIWARSVDVAKVEAQLDARRP